MDSLLLLGPKDERLERLLGRMGYDLMIGDEGTALAPLLTGGVIDLIVLDARIEKDGIDLLEYLKSDQVTKQIPLVLLEPTVEQKLKAEKLGFEKLHFLDGPCTPGALVSKIATELRLRKMDGQESSNASLSEINAALRDLNGRMQKEREEARAIQQSLLPERLPSDERIDFAASYDPLEEVGGDWYFTEKNEDGTISMLVADVTGHGLAAAFIGSMTKLALTAAQESDPGRQLSAMNSLMTPQLPSGRFVTMISAKFDPASGSVDVACAGHPPCLVVSKKNNTVTKIGGNGFALGFVDDAEYQVARAEVAPGDFFVLLTDGIVEAQNRANAMYGMEHLSEVLLANAERPAREIVAAVLKDLEEFCDGRLLKDDVTLLAIKRRS